MHAQVAQLLQYLNGLAVTLSQEGRAMDATMVSGAHICIAQQAAHIDQLEQQAAEKQPLPTRKRSRVKEG